MSVTFQLGTGEFVALGKASTHKGNGQFGRPDGETKKINEARGQEAANAQVAAQWPVGSVALDNAVKAFQIAHGLKPTGTTKPPAPLKKTAVKQVKIAVHGAKTVVRTRQARSTSHPHSTKVVTKAGPKGTSPKTEVKAGKAPTGSQKAPTSKLAVGGVHFTGVGFRLEAPPDSGCFQLGGLFVRLGDQWRAFDAARAAAGRGGASASSDIRLEGPGWTPQAEAGARAGIEKFHDAFPGAPKLETVRVVEDQTALGNKSNTGITVNPMFVSDQAMADHAKDFWAGTDSPLLLGTGRDGVIIHESGHILDGHFSRTDPKGYQAVSDYVTQPITYEVAGKSVTSPRWETGNGTAPSPYATTSRYEYVAEALTDSVMHGSRAAATSQAIAAIFHAKYGGG